MVKRTTGREVREERTKKKTEREDKNGAGVEGGDRIAKSRKRNVAGVWV